MFSLKDIQNRKIEECLPTWDDLSYDYVIRTSELITSCRFDQGMTGVDIFNGGWEDPNHLSVRYAKSLQQKCFHSTNFALPCFTPRGSDVFLSGLTKDEKVLEKMITKEISKLKKSENFKHYKDVFEEILKNPAEVPSRRIPSFLKRRKKLLLLLAKRDAKLNHPAGSLCCVKVNENSVILHAGGNNLNRLKKVILNDQWNSKSSVHRLKSKPMVTFDDGSILQIETTPTMTESSIHCAVRTNNACHLGRLSEKCKFKELETLRTDDIFTCVNCSPFVFGEFVYATEKGEMTLRNVEVDLNITRQLDQGKTKMSDPWFGCSFGSHPRCLLGSTRKIACLYDLRQSNCRSLPLFSHPTHFLSDDDLIYSTSSFPGYNTHHLINTTTSVLLMDERFVKQPVLKWSHMLNQPPDLCRTHVLPPSADILSHSANVIIFLANSTSQQIATVHATQEGQDNTTLFSHCPCLHLSKPSDLIDQLLGRENLCVSSVIPRLSVPILGIDAFSDSSSSNASTSVFELTLTGDIFYQNLNHLGGERPESNLNRNLDDEVVEKLRQWILENGQKFQIGKREPREPKDLHDGSLLTSVMSVRRSGKCDCGYYCINKEVPSVFDKSKKCSNLVEFGLDELDVDKYDDKASCTLMKVWKDEVET